MAKESLREHLNRKLKEKGTTLKAEKAKAKKYKSIAEAKKAKSLYYTDKNGKVMAAVYATDLKDKGGLKTSLRPKLRPAKPAAPSTQDKTKGPDGKPINPKSKPKVIPNDGPITEKTKTEVEKAMGGNYRKDALRTSGKFNKKGSGFKAGGMAKKKPAAKKMMGGGSTGYMYGGMTKKKK